MTHGRMSPAVIGHSSTTFVAAIPIQEFPKPAVNPPPVLITYRGCVSQINIPRVFLKLVLWALGRLALESRRTSPREGEGLNRGGAMHLLPERSLPNYI